MLRSLKKDREYLPGGTVDLVNSEYDKEEILSQPTIPIVANETPTYLAA